VDIEVATDRCVFWANAHCCLQCECRP
jgi:hypothetical protein